MTKRNFDRNAGYSLCPRSTAALSQDIAKVRVLHLGKGTYYAGKGRLRVEKEVALDPDYLEEARKHKQRVKLRKDRLRLIKEMAELNKL